MAKKEKSADAPAAEGKSKKKKSGKKPVFLMIVVSIAMIIFIQMSYIFFICGILPSIAAYISDRSPGKHQFQTVFTCNLAGVLPFLGELMGQGNGMSDVQLLLSDLTVWLAMYSAAGMGWVLIWLSPFLMRGLIGGYFMKEILQRESTQRKLLEEWGPEIKRRELLEGMEG